MNPHQPLADKIRIKKLLFTLSICLVLFSGVSAVCTAGTVSRQAYPQEEEVETEEYEEVIYSWRLTDYLTSEERVKIDTFLVSFQKHNPVFQHSISASFLGNPGLASKSNIFIKRDSYNNDLIFQDPFRLYFHNPANTRFYNTRKPYSSLQFSTGGPSGENEKTLGVLHTQNVTPDFNIGFKYDNINAEGQYREQDVRTNAISFFSSYHTERYTAHGLLNINSVNNHESGGLQDDQSLGDPQLSTTELPVRLNDVVNIVRNNNFFLSHSFIPFGGVDAGERVEETEAVEDGNRDNSNNREVISLERLELSHVFHYENFRRVFEDPTPPEEFYDNFFISPERTYDSTSYRRISNSLLTELPGIETPHFSFSVKGGVRNEQVKKSYNIPHDTIITHNTETPDTTVVTRESDSFSSNAALASASSSITERLEMNASAHYYFSGYRQGEYNFSARADLSLLEGKNSSILSLFLKQKETKPSPFLNRYSSNHFKWENDFDNIGESRLGGSFNMPSRDLEAGLYTSLLNNYIYMDTSANPAQHDSPFPVLTAYFKKDFSLWRFNFRNKLYYQASGQEDILPLPSLSLYSSVYYEQTFLDGMLLAQAGFDIFYNTPYYAYAYQPATAQFHLQKEKKLGNYPYVDVFINFQHKNRFRAFFKAEHLNANFTGNDYFSVLHHPRNEQLFKLGISWIFYD